MAMIEASAPVLVTGAAGFIGSHVVEALAARAVRTVGLDNFDPFYDPAIKRATLRELAPTPGFTFVEGDLTDRACVDEVFRVHKPRALIHLAAKAGVRPSLEDPAGYMHANVTGTALLLDRAARAGCACAVVASSSSVYGNSATSPFAETQDVSEPISPYAASKRACELLGYTHWKLTGMPTAMLRFFTVYGPRQRPDLAIAKFFRAIREGRSVPMFGDGSMRRDYTYIDDIVSGVLAALDRVPQFGYRIWNLGGSRPVRLDEMVAAVGRVAGRPLQTTPSTMQPGDVQSTWADLTRSGAELGFTPQTRFEDGLARQWAWTLERA